MRAAVPLLLLLTSFPTPAQSGGVAAAPVGVRPAQVGLDSARAVRRARTAQASFETLRFGALPWTDRSGGGPCDEVIGRFCITYGDPDVGPDWIPPPEPPRVRDARSRLLARLDSAARAAPGDAWIAGQRVRYLVEAGRPSEAAEAARACRAQSWWCRALEGFAHHRAGSYRAAEAAFDAALERMEERQRREWTDLSTLLRPGEGGAYARTRGAQRQAAERRFWWLADPLWMDSANDRRTEHFARWVWDRLQDRSRNTERIAWGEDLEEIVVRFGFPTGWERIRPRPHETGPASVVTHYPPRGREFLPAGGAVRPAAALAGGTWDLFARRSRTDYAPAYASYFDSLPHHLAMFRRGAQAVVVAGFQLDRDSVRPDDVVHGGLVLARDEERPMEVEVRRSTGAAGALRLLTGLDSGIVSVEALAPDRRRAARARYPLSLRRPPAPGLSLSDLLLLADPSARPQTLESAWPLARPTVRVRPGERLGLFWELYRDGAEADTLRLSVSLTRAASGGLRRLAERVGLAGGGSPVRIRWSEEAGASPVLGRALGVALPERLPPGEYHLELTVQPARGGPVSRTRTIFVER